MQLLATIKTIFHWDVSGAMHSWASTPSSSRHVNLGSGTFTENSPFLTEFMTVQCHGFKGMAYRDIEGHWRAAYTDIKLPEPVRILE